MPTALAHASDGAGSAVVATAATVPARASTPLNDFNAAVAKFSPRHNAVASSFSLDVAVDAAPPSRSATAVTSPSLPHQVQVPWSSLLPSDPRSDTDIGIQNLALRITNGDYRRRPGHDFYWRRDRMGNGQLLPDWRGILYFEEVLEYEAYPYNRVAISPAWIEMGAVCEKGFMRVPGALDGPEAVAELVMEWERFIEDDADFTAWLAFLAEADEEPLTVADLFYGVRSSTWNRQRSIYNAFIASGETGGLVSDFEEDDDAAMGDWSGGEGSGGWWDSAIEMEEDEEDDDEEEEEEEEEVEDDDEEEEEDDGGLEYWQRGKGTGWSSEVERGDW